ncbi:hypothetical protein [Vibrio harveyi]|uniref:hypothetical protein n=1 Tax=Vibrio harveyi TaxID=669 RepID=UPI0018F1FAD9|nr:hypothetical protein [Vibrio harveyi]
MYFTTRNVVHARIWGSREGQAAMLINAVIFFGIIALFFYAAMAAVVIAPLYFLADWLVSKKLAEKEARQEAERLLEVERLSIAFAALYEDYETEAKKIWELRRLYRLATGNAVSEAPLKVSELNNAILLIQGKEKLSPSLRWNKG